MGARANLFSTHKGKTVKKTLIALIVLAAFIMALPHILPPTQQQQVREGAQGGEISVGNVYAQANNAKDSNKTPQIAGEEKENSLEDQNKQKITKISEDFVSQWANYTPETLFTIQDLPSISKNVDRQTTIAQQIKIRNDRISQLQESATFTSTETKITSLEYDGKTIEYGNGEAIVEISGSALISNSELGSGGTSRDITYVIALSKNTKERNGERDWFISSVKEKEDSQP